MPRCLCQMQFSPTERQSSKVVFEEAAVVSRALLARPLHVVGLSELYEARQA